MAGHVLGIFHGDTAGQVCFAVEEANYIVDHIQCQQTSYIYGRTAAMGNDDHIVPFSLW